MHNRIGERSGDHFADVGNYEAPNFIFNCGRRYPGDERIDLFMQPKTKTNLEGSSKDYKDKFAHISATL